MISDHTAERLISTSSKRSVELVVGCHGRTVQSLFADTVHSSWLNTRATEITETTNLAARRDGLRSLDDCLARAVGCGVLMRVGTEACAIHASRILVGAVAALTVCHLGSIWTSVFASSLLDSQLVCNVLGVGFVDTSGHEQILLLLDLGCVIQILTRVGSLVFKDLDELVKASGND